MPALQTATASLATARVDASSLSRPTRRLRTRRECALAAWHDHDNSEWFSGLGILSFIALVGFICVAAYRHPLVGVLGMVPSVLLAAYCVLSAAKLSLGLDWCGVRGPPLRYVVREYAYGDGTEIVVDTATDDLLAAPHPRAGLEHPRSRTERVHANPLHDAWWDSPAGTPVSWAGPHPPPEAIASYSLVGPAVTVVYAADGSFAGVRAAP